MWAGLVMEIKRKFIDKTVKILVVYNAEQFIKSLPFKGGLRFTPSPLGCYHRPTIYPLGLMGIKEKSHIDKPVKQPLGLIIIIIAGLRLLCVCSPETDFRARPPIFLFFFFINFHEKHNFLTYFILFGLAVLPY